MDLVWFLIFFLKASQLLSKILRCCLDSPVIVDIHQKLNDMKKIIHGVHLVTSLVFDVSDEKFGARFLHLLRSTQLTMVNDVL